MQDDDGDNGDAKRTVRKTYGAWKEETGKSPFPPQDWLGFRTRKEKGFCENGFIMKTLRKRRQKRESKSATKGVVRLLLLLLLWPATRTDHKEHGQHRFGFFHWSSQGKDGFISVRHLLSPSIHPDTEQREWTLASCCK